MATMKATSSKSGTSNLENYLKREEKTEKLLMTGKDCDIDNFSRDFEITKELHNKTNGRQHYHLIQSFAPGEISTEMAHKVGNEFLKHYKFKGFQAVCITHKDKEHIHNHIVINSVNSETGKKFQQNKKDLYSFREFNDKLCIERGLSVIEKDRVQEIGKVITYNQEKYKILEKHFQGKGKSYVVDTAIAVKKSIEKTTSRESFIDNMEKLGYKTNWSDTRKNVTFENIETGKKVRLSNLEKTFTDSKFSKEGLNNEFTRNREQQLEIRGKERSKRELYGQDIKDFSYSREPKHDNSEGLLRVHEQFTNKEQRFTELDRGQYGRNEETNIEQPRHQRGNKGYVKENDTKQYEIKRATGRGIERDISDISSISREDRGRAHTNSKELNNAGRNNKRIEQGISKTHSRLAGDTERSTRLGSMDKDEHSKDNINNRRSDLNKHDYSNSFDYVISNKTNADEVKQSNNKIKSIAEKGNVYTKISKEKLEKARSINLPRYLENQGYTLEKDSIKNGYINYKIKEIKGLVVSENGKWYDFQNSKGGKSIDFVVEYEGLDFKKAVEKLVNSDINKANIKIPTRKDINIELPEIAYDNYKITQDYLCNQRGISKVVVVKHLRVGNIYASNEKNSIIFVGKDKDYTKKYGFERSIIDDRKSDVKGSQKDFAFISKGILPNKVYVFESAIDLLSYETLNPENNNYKISLGGTSSKALDKFVYENKTKDIVLCLDNDPAGIKASKNIAEKYSKFKANVTIEQPKTKDWNIDLKETKRVKTKLLEQLGIWQRL